MIALAEPGAFRGNRPSSTPFATYMKYGCAIRDYHCHCHHHYHHHMETVHRRRGVQGSHTGIGVRATPYPPSPPWKARQPHRSRSPHGNPCYNPYHPLAGCAATGPSPSTALPESVIEDVRRLKEDAQWK